MFLTNFCIFSLSFPVPCPGSFSTPELTSTISIDEKITALLMDAKEFGSGKTFGWDAYERDEGKEMLRQFGQKHFQFLWEQQRVFGCLPEKAQHFP